SGLRIESRRIARPDTYDAPRELLLANDLVHMAIEDELHTFFTRAELQTSRQCRAIYARAFAGDEASILHHAWREVTRAYLGDSGVLFRNRTLLDVRRWAFHEEGHGAPRSGQAAIRVCSEYPAKADVICHQEFSRSESVIGIGPMQIAFVVS